MPLSLFSRKKIVYFTLGITALLYFWEWVAAEQAGEAKDLLPQNDNATAQALSNTTQIIFTLAAAGVDQAYRMLDNSQQISNSDPASLPTTLKKIIRSKIILENDYDSNYTAEIHEKDVRFISKIIMNLYQSSPLDKCKLDIFFNGPCQIKLVSRNSLTTLKDKKRNYAMYLPAENIILLPHNIFKENSFVISSIVSHELRHLIDSDNNKKSNLWQALDLNGKPFYPAMPWGNFEYGPIFDLEEQDSYKNLVNLINKDISHVTNLHAAFLKPIKSRTEEERASLAELKTLIEESVYMHNKLSEPMTQFMLDALNEPYNKVFYEYNSATDKYIVDRDIGIARFENTVEFKEGRLQVNRKVLSIMEHVIEYSPTLATDVTFTLTDPGDYSTNNLMLDLFINLKRIFYGVKTYDEEQWPSEYGAFFDEILSPYPRLRTWLFPNLTKHEENRFSGELRRCLGR